LVGDLQPVLRDEQMRRHALAKLEEPTKKQRKGKSLVVHAHHVASRMQVAKLYYEHVRSCGWKEGEREPWGARRACPVGRTGANAS